MSKTICENCGKTLDIPRDMMNGTVTCPACGKDFFAAEAEPERVIVTGVEFPLPKIPSQQNVVITDIQIPFGRILGITFYVVLSLLIVLIPIAIIVAILIL